MPEGLLVADSCKCMVLPKHSDGQKLISGFNNVHAVGEPEHGYTGGKSQQAVVLPE